MVVACKSSFDAAHILWGYKGKCGNLHGHTYKIEVSVSCKDVDRNEMGMVADYTELKRVLKPIIEKYDHAFLSGSEDGDQIYRTCMELGLKIKNISGYSTTENIARQIMKELIAVCKEEQYTWYPSTIRLSETDSTYAVVSYLEV